MNEIECEYDGTVVEYPGTKRGYRGGRPDVICDSTVICLMGGINAS